MCDLEFLAQEVWVLLNAYLISGLLKLLAIKPSVKMTFASFFFSLKIHFLENH